MLADSALHSTSQTGNRCFHIATQGDKRGYSAQGYQPACHCIFHNGQAIFVVDELHY